MNRNLTAAALICISIYTNGQTSYEDSINDWHQQRIGNLKKETGWLNLAGLYWLRPGKNSFGSGDEVQIKFPKETIPADAGYFELAGTTVSLHTNEQTPVYINNELKKDAVIFSADSSGQVVCRYGSLRWTIIKREDKIGIRLRDLNSTELKSFTGIDRFPVDSNFRVTALLREPVFPASVLITNVLGQTMAEPSPGKLFFTLKGKQYSLDALEEDGELFIIFGDATSGEETYPAGRFLYAKKPGKDGKTVLDFNKAYNPPCAFTPYATCPIPPKQNILPVAITAGEKNYEHH